MARNGSGTYAAPANSCNPAIAGTAINPTDFNAIVDDVETALTDSLSRGGSGGMLAPLGLTDGTVGAPSLKFNDEATSGLYRVGAGDVRLAILGALVQKLTAAGVDVTGVLTASGVIKAGDGAVGGPGLSFGSEATSGLYRAGASDVRLAVAGTDRAKWTASGLFADVLTALTAVSATVKGAIADGASAVGVVLDNTIALANAGAKLLSVKNAGTEKFALDKDGKISVGGTGEITLAAGTNWTINTSIARQGAGIVTIYLQATATVPSAVWTSVATVPAGARPSATVLAVGSIKAGATEYPARFSIATNGVIGATEVDNGTSWIAIAGGPAIGTNDTVSLLATFYGVA